MIVILDQLLNRVANIKSTLSCSHTEELNGEHTLEFTTILDSKMNNLLLDDSVFEYAGQLFDVATMTKTSREDGSFDIKVEAEHVSYRLNNKLYNLEYFTKIGTPDEIFTEILKDTPFINGGVEFGTPTGTQTSGATIVAREDINGDIIIDGLWVGVDYTTGVYYKTAVFNPISGKVTYSTPSEEIEADEAFTGDYFYLPDAYDPEHKYIKLKTLVGSAITFEVWELRLAYSLQQASSRRSVVMDFVAYVYGEVMFNQFTIGIVKHIGNIEPTVTVKNRDVSVVSREINKRQLDKDGNPTISYECTPIYTPTQIEFYLGDNIILVQQELGIREDLRVVRITRDPYDLTNKEYTFSKYVNGLAESIYRVETSNVVKDKMYNGTRIGPQFGFENIRADKRARSFFRADDLRFQSGPATNLNAPTPVWKDRLYFEYEDITDPDNSDLTLKFNGILDSEVIVTPNLYVDNGNIANLTVKQLDTSIKVENFLHLNKSTVTYMKMLGQCLQFIEATIPTTGYGSRILSTGTPYDMELDVQSDMYYLNVTIKQTETVIGDGTAGNVIFENGAGMNAWDAIHSGRIYREVVGETKQYIKLTGVGPTGWKVLWDTYETFTYGYSINKLPMPDGEGTLDESVETGSIVYYRGVTVDGITGALSFTDPSAEITVTQAWFSDPKYIYRPHADSDKFYKMVSAFVRKVNGIDITFIDYEVYSSSQDWDMQEQYKNKEGSLCYWLNDSYKIMTTTVTPYPVYIYKYAEFVKMEHAFVEQAAQLIPKITLGAGVGDGDKGKGRIFKDIDGLCIEYYSTVDGNPIGLYLKNDGITCTPGTNALTILDQNSGTRQIKTWAGTLAEYTAIVSKDTDTLYYCTD